MTNECLNSVLHTSGKGKKNLTKKKKNQHKFTKGHQNFHRELVCLPLRAKEESCKFLPPPLVGGLLCWKAAVSATIGFSSLFTPGTSFWFSILTTGPVYGSLSTFCGILACKCIGIYKSNETFKLFI